MEKIKLISQNKVEIEGILSNWFSSKTFSDDKFFVKKIEGEDLRITVFIAEDYYLRIDTTLTLTVIVENAADRTAVEIISSGGKEGLLGFSYGAEKNAVKRIVKLLKENGFTEQ